MNWFPIIFTISFFFPGIFEAYAAFKVFPFIKYKGGLVVFIFFTLGAQFDLILSVLMLVAIIFQGKFVFDIPWNMPLVSIPVIYLIISLFLWRFASGSLALWFAGRLTENPIRKLLGVPEFIDKE